MAGWDGGLERSQLNPGVPGGGAVLPGWGGSRFWGAPASLRVALM